MGKCELFSFMLKIILLRHKVGLCLHGHIYARTFKMNYVIAIYMYMYCIERSVNISITRITRVNNICFCHVAISDDISTHANFQVDGYHWLLSFAH